jgi:histidinol-phosphate aminotransferase
MEAYVPGEQPPPGTRVIKLNTNENPYPPSPAAMEALRGIEPELLRRYPDPFSRKVCRNVSRVFGVPEDWVLVGNGSDEIMSMIIRACSGPQRRVAYPMPTYVLYRTLAQMQEADYVEIPFDDEYNLPLSNLIETNAAVTLIASPNSPSGTLAPISHLKELAMNLQGVLVVDEAYTDFADGNALELVKAHDNVIVLRTLSKGYSLAGLRLGFGIANPDLLKGLFKIKDSYNVDAISCIVGAAAIEDQQHKKMNAEKVKKSRVKLSSDLAHLGFQIWPSQSNFLLVRPPEGNAERLYLLLKGRGILVRYFKQPRLDDKLRISVGTEEQNTILIDALSGLLL